MIRLIIAGLVLAVALAVTAVTHATYAGASAVAVSAVAPSTLAGRVLGGWCKRSSRPRPSPHSLSRIGALAASIEAFGGGPGIVQIGAVYLAAAALAAVAPTPGGLGPLEAALVSLLTVVGMAAGPAFSAVLLYRLATYWLPVAPGWLSWRVLQRREYV